MKCTNCGQEATGDVCGACGETIEGSPKWYIEGIVHYSSEKNFAMAQELLDEALKAHPTSPLLWFNGGVLAEQRNNRQLAVKCYQEVLKLRPNNDKARQALERLTGKPVAKPAPASAPQPAPTVVATPPPAPAAVAVAETPDKLDLQTLPPLPPSSSSPAATPTPAPPAPREKHGAREKNAPRVETGGNGEAKKGAKREYAFTKAPVPVHVDRRWQLLGTLAGLLAVLSFLAMVTVLVMAPQMPKIASLLFTAVLLLFVASSIVYFVGKALGGSRHRRK